MAPTEEKANALLVEAKKLVAEMKAEEALAPAQEALSIFRELSDQAGAAQAIRPLLAAQMARGDLKPDEALKFVKEEAGNVKRSARDGRKAEALVQLAQAEVHLARAEPIKAVQLAREAETYFERNEDWQALAEVLLEVVAPAQLQRCDGKKALAAANMVLEVAQKVKDPEVEARAWGLVSAGRFASGAEDAEEAGKKAVDLFRSLGSKIREASTLLDLARGQLSKQDHQAALNAAKEALAAARSSGSWAQVGMAAEAIVESELQAQNPQAALSQAEELLSLLQQQGVSDRSRQKGTASAMSAVVIGISVMRGIDDGLEAVKKFVEQCRADGNTLGEVRMLHKLATMSPFPDYATNTAQAALAIAQKKGLPFEEKILKKTLTDLYFAQGKIEKAPLRRDALLLLKDLAAELERKDGDKFDDANKNLDQYWSALTQSDVDSAMQKVIAKDATGAMEFLKEHGANVATPGESTSREVATEGLGLKHSLVTGPLDYLYFSFRASGIAYGPRYRCVVMPAASRAEAGKVAGAIQLQDISDDWERELGYNPSILDCSLQSGAATQYLYMNP
eukprot:TRINITY_DN78843_c0_g1_i1.p1 TRINITY_DN78843_c0_g1~~TRINITY_DN78843_c0_g1_i1.p1  ORF type:complete len:585 (+),score=152.23 TRINITY_DN78843_c0_g1_i1:58-1755(+)